MRSGREGGEGGGAPFSGGWEFEEKASISKLKTRDSALGGVPNSSKWEHPLNAPMHRWKLLLILFAADSTSAYQASVLARASLRRPSAATSQDAVCRVGANEQQQHPRRAMILSFAASGFFAAVEPAPAGALDAVIGKDDSLPAGALAPSGEETQVIKDAIQAFDNKQLAKAESLFSKGIEIWCVSNSDT